MRDNPHRGIDPPTRGYLRFDGSNDHFALPQFLSGKSGYGFVVVKDSKTGLGVITRFGILEAMEQRMGTTVVQWQVYDNFTMNGRPLTVQDAQITNQNQVAHAK